MGSFGEFFKMKRTALGLTLREFCEKHKLDPGNISKLERGRLAPPKEKKLEEYAQYLGIKKGSDDWYEFFDLATAEAGRIPSELMEEELVQKLPILFRTARGKKPTEEELEKFITFLKKEL
ncbi:MAG: helix-turn-helix domain-containing protein [Candidatus Omnitrophota bacterium]